MNNYYFFNLLLLVCIRSIFLLFFQVFDNIRYFVRINTMRIIMSILFFSSLLFCFAGGLLYFHVVYNLL